jgi:nicotinamide-nucleotide amidase
VIQRDGIAHRDVTEQPRRPPPVSRIEVVTIGDELLLGFTLDSNAAHLARELASIGVQIVQRSTVGDDASDIARVVGSALERTGAVITTGGLGPTSDDRTKAAIAEIFGREMALDEEHLAWMERRWAQRFNAPLPAANRQQAMIPVGARKLTNNHGSAPGIWLEDDRGRWVAMLPGVPREMRGMLADTLLPLIRERVEGGAVVRSRTLRTTGVAESLLADRIDALGKEPLTDGVSLAYLPSVDGVDLRLTVRGRSPADADAMLDEASRRIRECLGSDIYGEDGADLAALVLDRARADGLTIAVAESCTGGLLGARLTSIPGSSDVILGGVIAYHNTLKREQLGVPQSVLDQHGAVSEAVVRQMAAGVRVLTGASVGFAITGVAGPTGGTAEKPVGTVWIAADVDGAIATRHLRLWGDREEIRHRATQATLDLFRRRLQDTTRR